MFRWHAHRVTYVGYYIIVFSMVIEFKSKTIEDFRSQIGEPPDTLYHYTNLESARRILQGKEMWASDVRYMNDANESDVMLQPWISEVRKSMKRIDQKSPQRTLLRTVALQWMFMGLTSEHVLSFTTEHDDLSQFRAYSKGETGVCIAFDSGLLRKLYSRIDINDVKSPNAIERVPGRLIKCKYWDPKNSKIVDELIKSMDSILYGESLDAPEETGQDVSLYALGVRTILNPDFLYGLQESSIMMYV